MKLSQQSKSLLTTVFETVAARYSQSDAEPVLTDIHFLPLQDSGELVVFDDDDVELARASVVEWTEPVDDFDRMVRGHLQDALTEVNRDGVLEHLNIWKPYSFVLVDEDKETVCDLLLVDDDTLIVTDQLLQGLDEELNSFLDDLLND